MNQWHGFWGLLGWLGCAGSALAASLSGQLVYLEQANLGTLVPGVVAQVPVKKGQRVQRGALLLKLDDREYRATLTATSARTAHAELLLEEAQADYDRAEELYERTVLSEVDRRQAEIGLLGAKAAAAEAKAAKTLAALNLERSRIKAPFDGVVAQLNAVPGEAVLTSNGGKVLVVLARQASIALQLVTDAATAQALLAAGNAQLQLGDRQLPVRTLRVVQQQNAWQVLAEFDVPADMNLTGGQAAQLVWSQ